VAGAMAAVVAQRAPCGVSGTRPRKTFCLLRDTLRRAPGNSRAPFECRWGRRPGRDHRAPAGEDLQERKFLAGALLPRGSNVLKSEGNLNKRVRSALQLLRSQCSDEAAVVELGMSPAWRVATSGGRLRVRMWAWSTRVAPVHHGIFFALARRNCLGQTGT